MPVISPDSVKQNGKSCYTCIGGPSAEMANFLRLIFAPAGQQQYTMDVYIGQSYEIMYYDTCLQSYKTVIGTVHGISTEAIALYAVSVIDETGKLCLCSKKENLSGYIATETYHIPINNIAKIKVYTEPENQKPTERSETIVSVLGISSTVIHAVIVRLRIFDDKTCSSTTPVDMVVGRTYHVTWQKETDHIVYELVGRLVQIREVQQFGNESPECGYVRPDNNQVVGMDNNIYDPNYFHSLPKYNPDGDRIQFVFDTSKDFNRMYDTVMLKEIRNVHDTCPCPPPPPYPPCPPYPCPPPPPGWVPDGPCDMPLGWVPGEDPVDPGFSRDPIDNTNIWTPTQPISTSGNNPEQDYHAANISSNLWGQTVDPSFYR